MSLYRCQACGSPNVIQDTQKEGYSYVKGAIGTAVLGVGGAVAGINGKTKKVYKCPDCGLVLSEPMADEIKLMIDLGVSSEAMRKNLKLNGVAIDWSVLTNKYRNIEKTEAVCLTENKAEAEKKEEHQEEAPEASSEELMHRRLEYIRVRDAYNSLCDEWRKEAAQKTKKREKYIKNQIDKIIEEEAVGPEKELDEIAKQKEEAEERLTKLGFFNFSEKKSIALKVEELAALQIKKSKEVDRIYAGKTITQKQRSAIKKEAEKKFDVPLKPKRPNFMWKYKENGKELSDMELVHMNFREEIFRYVEANGPKTKVEIKKGCSFLADFSEMTISDLLRGLIRDEDLVEKKHVFHVRYDRDELNVMREEWVKKYLTDESCDENIALSTLRRFPDGLNLTEIQQNTPEFAAYTIMRISTIIRMLTSNDLALRFEIDGRAYFKSTI